MKENWINGMKRKLEGHKMEPPTGLWEDISRQMGLSPEPVRQPATMKRWYWAAAAGILALVGFFAVYHDDNPDSSEPLLQSEAVVVSQPTEQTKYSESFSESSSQPVSEPTLPIKQVLQPTTPLLAQVPNHDKVAKQEDKAVIEWDEPSSESRQTEDSSSEISDPSSETVTLSSETAEVQQVSDKPQHISAWPEEMLSSEKTPISMVNSQLKRWSVGVNASGGLLAANNTVRTGRVYQSSIGASYTSTASIHPYSQQIFSSYTTTDFVSKHHLPVRFGLGVQYQLNNHLALLSGINYTRLSTEFSIPLYPNIHYDQKLHYLGIPVCLAWQFWSTSHFRFYLSGGAMVEKCVNADLEAGDISKKPWQWSVNAAAGAEYTFIRQLGVYLEPSLGYYFDDGTSLEHYYKEHPLAPSIEFGLRLHFNDKK